MSRSSLAIRSKVNNRSSPDIPTIPDNWRSTRSTSLPSASRASRQRLPTSMAGMGSTKTVAPLSDTSWTMPGTR